MPRKTMAKDGGGPILRGSQTYLVVDYFSRCVEIVQLSHTRSNDVTVHLKSIFARHGIPEVLMSDNGPQVFAFFAALYAMVLF